MRRSAASLALAVGLVGAAAPALAQDAPPDEEAVAEARALFEQGVEASQGYRWAEAVDLFRRSRAIVERPSAVFNTAVALHRMGRVREALADTERYLGMTTASERGERQRYAQAEALREELTSQLAVLTLALRPDSARVEIDGRERPGEGAERDLDLDPGRHAIRITAEGHAPTRLDVRLSPGERDRREVTLEPVEVDAPAPPPPMPPPEEPPPPSDGLGELGVAGIAVGAVGVGAGVGALVTGLISQDTYDSLVTRCGPTRVCPPGSEDDLSSGEALAWVSTVLLGVSVVGIAVGVALLIVDLTSSGPSEQARLRVVPTADGAALRGHF